jgi:hypothetical protein
MVSDRAQQELQITNKRGAKDQEAWFKQLHEEALPKGDNRPKLRGRTAAKAKASREALEAARWEEIRKTFTDPNTIEEQQHQLQR